VLEELCVKVGCEDMTALKELPWVGTIALPGTVRSM
jgi:hypothetical protein